MNTMDNHLSLCSREEGSVGVKFGSYGGQEGSPGGSRHSGLAIWSSQSQIDLGGPGKNRRTWRLVQAIERKLSTSIGGDRSVRVQFGLPSRDIRNILEMMYSQGSIRAAREQGGRA